MNSNMVKILPFFAKVINTFEKEFLFSKPHFENGTLLMQKIGCESTVMVSNICSDKYLMTITIGEGILNIDILVTTPEEMVDYMNMYMPFIESFVDCDDSCCEDCECCDCDDVCEFCCDCDEPFSYTVNINEEAIFAAFEELAESKERKLK